MKTIFFLCLSLLAWTAYSQSEDYSKLNLGLGLGLGYGGIGARLNALPDKHVNLFAGVGYNLVGAGINVGIAARLLPDKRIVPTILGMYGYNSVIKVAGSDLYAEQYNKTYYGPSFGAGIEIHREFREDYFNIELLVPVRPGKFHDDFDRLDAEPDIEATRPWPVIFSFGYHFKF